MNVRESMRHYSVFSSIYWRSLLQLSVLSACLHAFLLSETYERACVLGLVLHRGSEGATVIAANTGSVVDPRLLDSGYAVSKLVYGYADKPVKTRD
jgi:hypothetical protein